MVYSTYIRKETIFITKLLAHKLKIAFKTNNSLKHTLQTRKQSKHKRDKHLASSNHDFSLTIRNVLPRLPYFA
jgi:hypothetical protein